MGISLFHLQPGRLSSLTFRYQSSWFSGLQILRVIPVAPLPFPLPLPPFQTIELELFHWVSWFSSMQTAHDGISQFPQSHQPIPIKLLL